MKCSEKLNLESSSPTSAEVPSSAIFLRVRGIGAVPSFKNRKRAILDSKTGKMRTLTEPKTKQWMDQATNQFESQLRGLFPTADGETHGAWQKRLQIALWQLLDDSLAHMLPGDQNVERVPKGEEGCNIVIEPL